MRDEEGRKKEGRKQARSNKQQGKATQHTQAVTSKEKRAASGGTRTHDTLHSILVHLLNSYGTKTEKRMHVHMYMYMYNVYTM